MIRLPNQRCGWYRVAITACILLPFGSIGAQASIVYAINTTITSANQLEILCRPVASLLYHNRRQHRIDSFQRR